jgi:hypothetical protein
MDFDTEFKEKMKKLLFAMLAAAACSGCVSRVADLTLCSTKNVDLKIPHPVDSKRRVTGETRTHIVILIPFGQESIKEAIDRAIESAPGAVALSDATIERGFWYIPYVYGEGWIAVEGNPVFE